jgi:hypothetical protein
MVNAAYYSVAKSSMDFLKDIPPPDKISIMVKGAFEDTVISNNHDNLSQSKLANILKDVKLNLAGVTPINDFNAPATTGFNEKILNNKDIGIS